MEPERADVVSQTETGAGNSNSLGSQSEAALRAVLRSLQPYLAEFGFRPTRVLTFLRSKPGMENFPTPGRFREICECERRGSYSEATTRLIEDLLCEDAPVGVVGAFMETLFDANDSADRPNEGAWRCHDILILASRFHFYQEALVDFIDCRGIDVDIIASVLCRSHALLTPDNLTQVMDRLQAEGQRSAAVYMFVCLYAGYVDTLQGQGQGQGQLLFDRETTADLSETPAWLHCLLDTMGRCGENIQRELPDLELSPDFWRNVDGQFAFRRSTLNVAVDDDAASDAGESVASDDTVTGDSIYRDRHTIRRLRAYVVRNFDVPMSRLPNRNPYNVEVVDHDAAAVGRESSSETVPGDDMDEQSSVITTISSRSGEDNEMASGVGRELPNVIRPFGKPGDIILRAYQEELLASARDRISVLIMLPTGTGKTYVVLKYVQEILSKPGTDRIVFLAPKVRLVQQQYNRFRNYFPNTTYFRFGNSRSCRSPFSQLLDIYRIYVMTPMCLVEAIRTKEVSITDFSVLVLDECHNTQGGHAYKNLMDLYMDAKFDNTGTAVTRMPQIIGLTASPGVGRGGNLTTAIAHVKTLCEDMDVERICTVKTNKEQLKYYINEPVHEIHRCSGRKKDVLKKIIERIMVSIENDMNNYIGEMYKDARYQTLTGRLEAPTLWRGQLRYTNWARHLESDLAELVSDRQVYTALFSLLEKLMDYQRALILNEDCESRYALDYLRDKFGEMRSMQQRLTHADRRLLQQFDEQENKMREASEDSEDYNPKLKMVEDILLGVLEKEGDNVSCMVFVRSIDLTKAIQQWMQKHPDLKKLAPGRIIGSKVTSENAGMTKAEISDVMTKFNNGDHKVVVCTSAAEEGLDFQACNVVVRYTYVTNVVSMIQTRGRARRMDSQYCVLDGAPGTSIQKERENLASEKLMELAVQHVQQAMDDNPNEFRDTMTEHQRSQVWSRGRAVRTAEMRRGQAGFYTNLYAFKCRKCREEVFTSADVRRVGQGSHTLVDERLRSRWVKARVLDIPQKWTMDFERIAGVSCKNCGLKWGSLTRYIPSGKEYPILKLEHFILEDKATRKEISRKMKWSDGPFSVPELSEQERANL